MTVQPWQGDELNQRQLDILWDTLSDNNLMPRSPIPSLNKQLNTNNKRIIGAINELLLRLRQNDTTVFNFSENFNSLVGNPELETEDWDNLKKIDRNVIRSIYKIFLEIGGENPVDISHIGPNVKSAIRELHEVITGLENRVDLIEEMLDDVYEVERLYVDPTSRNQFQLLYIPNDRQVILKINGVDYLENSAFTVDRPNKKLTWNFTESNGGFDLLEEFHIKAVYYYEPEQLI